MVMIANWIYDNEQHKAYREKDAKRFARLRSKGYIVVEMWEHDLRKEMRDSTHGYN